MSDAVEAAAVQEIAGSQLTRVEARDLAVIATRLDRRARLPRDAAAQKERLLEMIRTLGCVQLDTISVISRSHETVLWSRLGQYDPANLNALYADDGVLTEYWAHAAAIIPIERFPYYRQAMRWYREKYERPDSWAIENEALVQEVHARIAENGAIASRHFDRHEGPRPDPWTWYGGKPSRRALEHLWSRGDIMIARRESGFQRVYDLTERLVSADLLEWEPTEEERSRHFTLEALHALGVATPRWIADYFRSWAQPHNSPKASLAELHRLKEEGLAIPMELEGGSKESIWLDAALAPRLLEHRAGRGRPTLTTLLSPFDNLVWNRDRDMQLWDFFYRIEVYTPAPKRVYGYYSLPILHRGNLVGRLDAVVDRKARILTVRNVHLEEGQRVRESLTNAVADALWDLAGFLRAEEVLVLNSTPSELGPLLNSALQRSGA